LGITKEQAEEFVKKYGFSEELLIGRAADDAIAKSPSVIYKRLAREKTQQHLTRQRALTQRSAGTPQELEDAENDWRSAAASYDEAVQQARTVIANAVASKVALSQAEQTLKDMIIRVPIPKLLPPSLTRTSALSYGMTRRQVSEGQMIKEGEAVAELVIEDPIRLWSQVPEQYSEDVRVGQRVRLSTRAHPGVAIEGKVARINPSVDTASRTFQVETLVPNERGLLRPGGFAKASIITDAEAKAAVVPLDSIVRFAGVTKLFIIENGKARSINDIKTGSEGRGWIEVTSKLLPDAANVVTTGQTQLADGTPVMIREPEPPTPPRLVEEATIPETAAAVPASPRR
jgi:membrane fusion protein (multidrug efflux system)